MTEAPRVRPLVFADLDEAVAALRERGLRLSTPRRLVLEALFAADGPVSAEHLATRLGLDSASVYRNLETLEANGVVRHVHLGHGPGLHALVGPDEREYLYCESCGAVRAVAPDEFDPVRERIRELDGFEARFTHFPVVGLCARCTAGGSAPAAERNRGAHEHMHSHGGYVHSHSHAHSGGPGPVHTHDHGR